MPCGPSWSATSLAVARRCCRFYGDGPAANRSRTRSSARKRRPGCAGTRPLPLPLRSPAHLRLSTRLDELLQEMSASDEFASDVIAWTDHAGPGRRAWQALSADQKADLLVWARRNLPQEPDHPPGQVVDILPVHEFPRRVLTLLTSDVSELSVAALHRAADELEMTHGCGERRRN